MHFVVADRGEPTKGTGQGVSTSSSTSVVVFIILLAYTQQAYGLLAGRPRRNCKQLARKAGKLRCHRMIAGSALKRSAPRNERL